MAKWTQEEDDYLRENQGKLPIRKMAKALERGPFGVENRMMRLGLLKESAGVPLKLDNDDKLVAACMAEGWFPRAVVHAGKTFWVGHDGYPWRLGMMRAAA